MTVLSDTQIAAYAKLAGFTGPDLVIAVAVALGESGGNPEDISSTHDYGVWQVNLDAWGNLLTPDIMASGRWKDPLVNAAFAYHIWKWGGWAPWAAYTNGRYLKFMDRATAAVTPPEGGTMKADLFLFYAFCIRWVKYLLGAVPFFSPASANSKDPEDSDCSGAHIGLWHRAKVLFKNSAGTWVTYDKFFVTDRPTADVIMLHSTPIDVPSEFGDLIFHVDKITRNNAKWGDKHAYHIISYVDFAGKGDAGRTFESGDGTGRADFHTVGWQRTRGDRLAFGRLPHDMGQLTPKTGTPKAPDWPVMKSGFKGVPAMELKRVLKSLGCPTVLTLTWSVLGQTVGITTVAAIKWAQKKCGVPQTGIVDAATITAFQRALV